VLRPNTVGVSTLAAIAVPNAELETVAALVSAYPEVNHNYEREHSLNLWFVVTAPTVRVCNRCWPRSPLAAAIRCCRSRCSRIYHIDLGFDLKI